MSSSSEEEPAPKLVDYAKNSLYVRNLSPQINEQSLREIFGKTDVIVKVTFRAFPNSNNQFFAQIDFKTSMGVTEGTKLSGLSILGVACEVGVLDPIAQTAQQRVSALIGEKGGPADPAEAATLQEMNKRVTEAREDQRMRTVHVTGLTDDCTEDQFHRFCKKFGEVERLKVEKDVNGQTFGLVEYQERPAAHMIKAQGQFLVDGRVIKCTESKSMVDETTFEEQIVQFQAPILDGMNMKQTLSMDVGLKDKLEKVKQAALELAKAKGAGDEEEEDDDEEEEEAEVDTKKKKKKEKKEKKAKDALKRGLSKQELKELKKQKKKEKKEKKKQKKIEKKKRKLKEKQMKKKRRRKAAGEAVEDDDGSVAVSDSPGGPVDLDSEVEVVDTLMVLGESSASSVSSGDDSSDAVFAADPAPLLADAVEPVTNAPPSPLPAPTTTLSLPALVGLWCVNGDPKGIWKVEEGGLTTFNGKAVKPKWSLTEDSSQDSLVLFCEGQRAKGWELHMLESTVDRLVWKKEQEADAIWDRSFEDGAAVQGPMLEFGPSPSPDDAASPAQAE